VESINNYYRHHLLKHTVWENYRLISAQWPFKGVAPTPLIRQPFLANTTLETFNQPLKSPLSCITCHQQLATIAGTSGKSADLSFLLGEASVPTPAKN
jgi:hypothetical protein